ncbi:MAG: hypothetical protein EHM77_00050 [Planctomycetaceae bacterium]|nr:MAG: hypothetical protein EHM77_00050 [Planctomycetaceae bacterium]
MKLAEGVLAIQQLARVEPAEQPGLPVDPGGPGSAPESLTAELELACPEEVAGPELLAIEAAIAPQLADVLPADDPELPADKEGLGRVPEEMPAELELACPGEVAGPVLLAAEAVATQQLAAILPADEMGLPADQGRPTGAPGWLPVKLAMGSGKGLEPTVQAAKAAADLQLATVEPADEPGLPADTGWLTQQWDPGGCRATRLCYRKKKEERLQPSRGTRPPRNQLCLKL